MFDENDNKETSAQADEVAAVSTDDETSKSMTPDGEVEKQETPAQADDVSTVSSDGDTNCDKSDGKTGDDSDDESGDVKKPKKKRGKLVNFFKVFGFFLTVIAVCAGMYFGGRPDFPGPTRTYRTYKLNNIFSERKNSLDVLYVGHSGVYCGVSPMLLYEEYGMVGYNCTQVLLMPWEAYETVEDVLEEQSPKVIALEVDMFFYDTTSYIINSNLKRLSLDLFPFRETHQYWRDGFGRPERDFTKNFSIYGKITPYKKEVKREPTDKVYKLSESHAKYLNKFAELAKSRGIALELFELPSLKFWSYDRHNCIQAFADKHGLNFLDMNVGEAASAADINWKHDSRDAGDHLNYYGAKKTTRLLGKWLKELHPEIPDRRDDADYSEWKTDLKKYKVDVSEKT